jgi:hypothetical protein
MMAPTSPPQLRNTSPGIRTRAITPHVPKHQGSDHGAPPLPVARAADRVRSAVLDEQTDR